MNKNEEVYNNIRWSCVTKDNRRFDQNTKREITEEINYLVSLLRCKYNIKNIYISSYESSENS